MNNLSAGPTYSVAKLSDELHTNLGKDSSILTLAPPPSDWPYKVPLVTYSGLLEQRMGISYRLMRKLNVLMASKCIMHGHSIWRLVHLFPLMVVKHQAKIIWSPRGTLSEWCMGYKKTIKQPFWKLLQKPALVRCHCYHATSISEYEDIRRVGLRGPVAIIPNGIDIPDIPASNVRKKQIVFLSRINTIKGLDILLPAWKAVSENFTDWELIVAGPLNNKYAASIQELARKLEIPRIKFVGETLDSEKHKLLNESSLFVLPSYSENFGIVIAEALAHGMPVITTTKTPWTDLEQKKCGWCIKPSQNKLEQALNQALCLSLSTLEEMGENGRHWMQTDYSWKHISEMMLQTYEWLLNDAPKPDWIIKE